MIKKILNLLQPAHHLPEITDRAVVDKKYKYWRMRTFYSMYVGYLFYYFTRKSFTFVTPIMISDLGMSYSDIGILATILSLAYGISKFASGVISDRSNPRYFMAVGLILTGIANILFGLSSSLFLFAVFWGLNGWFQGWGWPACTKQLTHWFGKTERGTWWSACTTSHSVGGFLIAIVAAKFAESYGWRFGLFVPGVTCIFTGFWLMNRLRDVPQSLGLPTIESYRDEPLTAKESSDEILPIKQILFEHVLCNKYVWLLAVSYFFIYLVRMAVNDWGVLYLTGVKHYSTVAAASCVGCFEIGGFAGILLSGWGSDYLFKGKRIPSLVLTSLLLLACSIAGLWYISADAVVSTAVLFAIMGFLIFGPQMLVGLAAAEFVSKKAASTSNGFVGCLGALGAAVAGYPLSRITEIWGWYEFMLILIVSSVLAALALFPVWAFKTEHPTDGEKEESSSFAGGTVTR